MEPFRTGFFRFVLWGAVMFAHRVRRAVCAAPVILSFLFLFAIVAFAQDAAPGAALDRRQNAPGAFDFYVLSLSWSPTYCEERRERGGNNRPDPQCSGRPFAFVVHGFWPQYERGFPSYCQVPPPRLNRAIVSHALEVMPSPALVFHEWDRHGTCSGLSANAYFETMAKARAVVKIPEDYLELAAPLMVTPDAIAEAFVASNPGLARDDMAVVCNKSRLSEVRLCMSKDFSFQACPEIARRACKRNKVEMPAMRNAHAQGL
jgi:ribonuclease T2